jgi:hypothetical protein
MDLTLLPSWSKPGIVNKAGKWVSDKVHHMLNLPPDDDTSGLGDRMIEAGKSMVEAAAMGEGLYTGILGEFTTNDAIMAEAIDLNSEGFIGNLARWFESANEVVRLRAFQYAQEIGLPPESILAGLEIYKDAGRLQRAKTTLEKLNPSRRNKAAKGTVFGTRPLLKSAGISNPREIHQVGSHNNFMRVADSYNSLSTNKKRKHGRMIHNPQIPFTYTTENTIKRPHTLQQHHRNADGTLNSHYRMNIGERIANTDIMETGLGSIHYGSPGSFSKTLTPPFPQSNLLNY